MKKLTKRNISSFAIQIIFLSSLIYPLILNSNVSKVVADSVIVDYIFVNSNIISVDETNTIYEAIAIDDGEIIALGTTEEIVANYHTINETTYNLDGRTIMPGIIDGHTHLMASMLGGGYETMDGAQQIALAFGYTTLNEKSMQGWTTSYQPLLDAEANNELRLRVNIFPIHNLPYLVDNYTVVVEEWYPDYSPILGHDHMLRVPGIKIFADGAYGNRGLPAMSTPYTQEMLDAWGGMDPYGELYFNQTTLNETVKIIQDKGFSCAFHAMGDRGIETVLNAIEFALNGTTNDEARHQIEHNSFMREDLITKALSLNTIHSVRGYFPTYWQKEDGDIFGETWREWYVNRYSFPEVGLHSYLETDFAWHLYDDDDLSNSRNIKPFLHMWGLVTRKAYDENGTIHEPDPWVAEHEITVEQALRMMTNEGAYAVKQEDYIGSLEVGKYADLIVLNADPLTIDEDDIKDIDVLLTMVNGNIEFLWPSHDFPLPFSTTTATTQFGFTLWSIFFIIPSICLISIMLRRKNKEN